MGGGSYSSENRSSRSKAFNYSSVGTDDATFKKVFENQEKRQADPLMNPVTILQDKKTIDRESRFSENHPNVIPILFGLDVTGSMGDIPRRLCAGALPTLMSTLLSAGYDISLMFVAIGDHKKDYYPFQIGQFESGDEELDMWLTKTFIEGGGGGNGGESYHLAWYFALNHVRTDFRDKLNKKPMILTIGDEPVHKNLPASFTTAVLGSALYPEGVEIDKLFKDASQLFEIRHIHMGGRGYETQGWENLIGKDNLVVVERHSDDALIKAIVEIVTKTYKTNTQVVSTKAEPKADSTEKPGRQSSGSIFDTIFGK